MARIKSRRRPFYDANIRDDLLVAALKRIEGLPLDTPFSEVLRIGLQEIQNEYKKFGRRRTSRYGQSKLSRFLSLDARLEDQKEDDDGEVRTLHDKIPQDDYLWRGLRRKDGAKISAYGVEILTKAIARKSIDPDGIEFRVFMAFLDVFEQDYELVIDNTPPDAPPEANPVLLDRWGGPKDFAEIARRLGLENYDIARVFRAKRLAPLVQELRRFANDGDSDRKDDGPPIPFQFMHKGKLRARHVFSSRINWNLLDEAMTANAVNVPSSIFTSLF